mmetsp:Transcript_9397/g.20589  ORF Transcript_9397/g.20589 Transcript_9397/m.20589 type:complete len:1235 (-) Transcript_9397:126-3830(-)
MRCASAVALIALVGAQCTRPADLLNMEAVTPARVGKDLKTQAAYNSCEWDCVLECGKTPWCISAFYNTVGGTCQWSATGEAVESTPGPGNAYQKMASMRVDAEAWHFIDLQSMICNKTLPVEVVIPYHSSLLPRGGDWGETERIFSLTFYRSGQYIEQSTSLSLTLTTAGSQNLISGDEFSPAVIALADLLANKTSAKESVKECQCVGTSRLPLPEGTVRPADYGQQCKTHDSENCGQWYGTDPGVGSYCCDAWCYVDLTTCEGAAGVFESTTLPGAYFSYLVCSENVPASELPAAEKTTCLAKYGPDACYCIGDSSALNLDSSKSIQQTRAGLLQLLPGGTADTTPPGYGTSCLAWDQNNCSDYYPNEGSTRWDTWCCRNWCYVNPSCPTAERSWLVNSTTPLFFSWDACADDSAKIETCPYQRTSTNTTGCECLGPMDDAAKYNDTDLAVRYDINEHYGSKCSNWDKFTCEANFGKAVAGDWCCADWCWVNGATCASARKSKYFHDRFFSYDTCTATAENKARVDKNRANCQFGPGRLGQCECLAGDNPGQGWRDDNTNITAADKAEHGWIEKMGNEYGWDCFAWDDEKCEENWGRRKLGDLVAETLTYDSTAKSLTFQITAAHSEPWEAGWKNVTVTFQGLAEAKLVGKAFVVTAATSTSFTITTDNEDMEGVTTVDTTGGSIFVELALPRWCCNDWCWVSKNCSVAKESSYWAGLYWADDLLACGREGRVLGMEKFNATWSQVTLSSNHGMFPADAVTISGVEGTGWTAANTEIVLGPMVTDSQVTFQVEVAPQETAAVMPVTGAEFALTQTFTQTTCPIPDPDAATATRRLEAEDVDEEDEEAVQHDRELAQDFSRRRGGSRRSSSFSSSSRRRAPDVRRRAPAPAPDPRRRRTPTSSSGSSSQPTQISGSTASSTVRRRAGVVEARRRRTTVVDTGRRRSASQEYRAPNFAATQRRRMNSNPYYSSNGYEVGYPPGRYQTYYGGAPMVQPYGYSGYQTQSSGTSTAMAFAGGAVAGGAMGYYMGSDRRRRWTRRRCFGSRRRLSEIFGSEQGGEGYGSEAMECADDTANPYDDFCVCAQGGSPPPECTTQPMPCKEAMDKYGSVKSADACGVTGCKMSLPADFSRDGLLAYNFLITNDTLFPLKLTLHEITNTKLLLEGVDECPKESEVLEGKWTTVPSQFKQKLFVQLSALQEVPEEELYSNPGTTSIAACAASGVAAAILAATIFV